MRQLLALIVLLTGLAAVSEPVRAADARVESVRLEQVIASHVQATEIAVRLAAQPEDVRPDGLSPALSMQVPVLPAIILKADRAHE